MKRTRVVLIGLLALSAAATILGYQARSRSAVTSLAAYAPQGALLAIESPDFAGLLKAWSASSEEQRWLKSDDYADFSRSRLFARLGDAQSEFAGAAGLAPDARFLQQVAGRQSLFAWYDIGKLEFLYITRLPAGEAAKTPLLALRGKFEQRKVGDTAFFVRTESDSQRTVAFAVRGDFLLLATRDGPACRSAGPNAAEFRSNAG